ncbi:hypothetical protein [Pseudomonas lundensis]|uniref:hypothetical protein n=1 Tax=Pseudomonas lundensis TaxID=86185 RepID=UPI003859B768
MKINMTHRQIKELLELSESSGDPESYEDMTLIVMDRSGHSGPGLYAQFQEVPEEGYIFLGADDEDQARGDALCDALIKSGQVQEC